MDLKFQREEHEFGVTYRNLLIHDGSWSVNVLRRNGGSISLYLTTDGLSAHGVVWDSLDNKPLNPLAESIKTTLTEMQEGIQYLLNAINGATEAQQPARREI